MVWLLNCNQKIVHELISKITRHGIKTYSSNCCRHVPGTDWDDTVAYKHTYLYLINQPRQVYVNPKDQILVADELNQRIQIFEVESHS